MRLFTFWYRCSLVGAAWLIAPANNALSAQGAMASVSGTVRTGDGAALADAFVTAGRRRATTDSLGRYLLDSLDAGPSRVVVRRIGFSVAASTFAFRVGERIHWDVTLHEPDPFKEFERQLARADQR